MNLKCWPSSRARHRSVLCLREIYKIIAIVSVTLKTLMILILVLHGVLSCTFPSRRRLILKVPVQKVSFSVWLAGGCPSRLTKHCQAKVWRVNVLSHFPQCTGSDAVCVHFLRCSVSNGPWASEIPVPAEECQKASRHQEEQGPWPKGSSKGGFSVHMYSLPGMCYDSTGHTLTLIKGNKRVKVGLRQKSAVNTNNGSNNP